ncbi:GMC family oxidoreductase [Shewanella algae]|uniref:GMC family oxidoreductase n=1 Tax=Shewanella algae TaxID=38313 RepID=UPI001AACFD79|nr:GMC family oxidoreductase [Shewanella algae]MBO2599426.1 GMC family oxidoreductase [Shewanella algae]
MPIADPILAGLAAGWKHTDGASLTEDLELETDVVIIGTGAGGGTAAEVLTQAGLRVLLLEAGPLKSSSDFVMEERRAYPELYQQAAAMKTQDKGISIFQGKSVGGSTTVNWTTSIRTPKATLDYWQSLGVKGLSRSELEPWFDKMEQRLNISRWPIDPNRNNQALRDGCVALGWDYTVIKRNVLGCWNTGYCGMGCPVNDKQSMLVTTIPAALNAGAELYSHVRAERFEHHGERVFALRAEALDGYNKPTGVKLMIRARHYVVAAGAIHTPALLLRSQMTDPYQRLGKQTCLHPTVLSGARFREAINAHSGAPQSIYSDQFVWQDGATGQPGYKLEVPPVHPVLIASKTLGYGPQHAELMSWFNHLQVTIALIRDGFSPELPGAQVLLTDKGTALDYPLTPALFAAARRAFASMAELQFAAGAEQVMPINEGAGILSSWQEAKQVIADMPLAPLKTIVASAHVMGGCAMGEDRQLSWVNSEGQAHYYSNLSVMDGSVFPSSLGANPQLSIYGLTARNASLLARRLKPEPAEQDVAEG